MAQVDRRAQLEERASQAMTEWFAATDPYIADLARRRYRRALKALKALDGPSESGAVL